MERFFLITHNDHHGEHPRGAFSKRQADLLREEHEKIVTAAQLKLIQQRTHGGIRKGAGRKPSPDSLKPLHTKLPPDVIDWLREHRRKTGQPINEFIRLAILAAIGRTPSK